jgi:hypothetical protein
MAALPLMVDAVAADRQSRQDSCAQTTIDALKMQQCHLA